MSICKLCNNEFSSRWYLRKHVEQYHGGSKLTCEVCSKKFHKHETYNLHMRRTHGSDTFILRENFAEVEEREMKIAIERKRREDEENRIEIEALLEEECKMMVTLERLLERRDKLTEEQIIEYETKLRELRDDDINPGMIPTSVLPPSKQQDIELIKALFF